MTFRDAARQGKVEYRGHTWRVEIAVNECDAILMREVRVQGHLRGVGDYRNGHIRVIEVRRSLDMVVKG